MSNPQDQSNQPWPNPDSNNYPPPGYYGYPNQQPPTPGSYPPPPGYPNQPPGFQEQPPFGYVNQPPPPGYYSPPPGYPGAQMPYGFVPPYGYTGQMPPYGYPGAGVTPANLAKAEFWPRVGATLIDGLIFLPLSFIITIVFVVAYFNSQHVSNGTYIAGRNIGFGAAETLFVTLIAIVPAAIYQIWMVSLGQTLGDKAVKIRIMDSEGGRPGVRRSFMRYILPLGMSLISSIINNAMTYAPGNVTITSNGYSTSTTGSSAGIGFSLLFDIFIFFGYLWMLWDPNKQTLYDKLAGTYVVKTV